jgi:hypothetical protein
VYTADNASFLSDSSLSYQPAREDQGLTSLSVLKNSLTFHNRFYDTSVSGLSAACVAYMRKGTEESQYQEKTKARVTSTMAARDFRGTGNHAVCLSARKSSFNLND